MTKRHRNALALISTVGLGVFVACSSDDRGAFATPPTEELVSDASSPPAPPCGERRCSRDLHAVLDGCGSVVETCAPNLGCAGGKCVPACESAARSQGSIGCSFWTTAPDVQLSSQLACFATFIANTWSTPVSVRAELGREPLDISRSVYRAVTSGGEVRYERIVGAIPPGEVGIVFLAEGEDTPSSGNADGYAVPCPPGVEFAHKGLFASDSITSRYDAVHLETDAPVSAYSIFPYGGAPSFVPSATLLLPSSSWGTSYVLMDGWGANVRDPFIQIVAQEDDTEVRIRPTVDILAGRGVDGTLRGTIGSWRLRKGEVLEITQPQSIAGNPLESTRPVAVFGGSKCALIPRRFGACDALQQQIPPVNQWAVRYSGVPYKSRRRGLQGTAILAEAIPWRITAARDGTVLTYDPARPEGAPASLNQGDVVTFTTESLFSVKSQDAEHPIYLAMHMTGALFYDTLGDPDFVNVIPDEQFLDRYVFFIDYTYADSTLTFVRRKDSSGFHDVTLDCVGSVSGWQPLGTDGSIEYAWVDVTKNRTNVGNCSYGRHEASSAGPFGLYVWGMDVTASYGYPAGAGSRPTSSVTVEVR